MNIWNLIHEEIKTSLNFTNKSVLTNLFDHLIIVTKTYNPPPLLLPQSNLKMPKTQYINENFYFYLKQIIVNGTSRFCQS
jgi:hypothetical protein